MEQTQPNNSEPLEPQQAAAKAALLAECARLAAAGITFVAVHFDGYGDDGTTEEVNCYDSEWYPSFHLDESDVSAASPVLSVRSGLCRRQRTVRYP